MNAADSCPPTKPFSTTLIEFALVFCLTLAIIGLLFAIRWWSLTPDMPADNISKSDILQQCKTGDLIAASCEGGIGAVIRIFTGSLWSHVGIVYRAPSANTEGTEGTGGGPVHVIEINPARSHGSPYPKMPRIEQWFETFKARKLVYIKHASGPDVCSADVMSIFNQTKEARFDTLMLNWCAAIFVNSYREQSAEYLANKRYFCSEYISHYLHELGIIRKEKRASFYSPHLVVHRKLPFQNGHSYAPFKLIIP